MSAADKAGIACCWCLAVFCTTPSLQAQPALATQQAAASNQPAASNGQPAPSNGQPAASNGQPAPIADKQARYRRDRQGRVMRVGFDPGSRWWVGLGWAPGATTEPQLDGRLGRLALDTGVAYRQLIPLEEGTIAYKLYHRALDTRIWLGPERGPLQMEATAYQLRFMRWTADGRIMLPTSPPRRVAFPFNIGMDTTVSKLRFAQYEGGYQADVGVIHSSVVLDPWRQRRLRSFLQLGVGPRYDLRLQDQGGHSVVQHLVAPFTTATLRFHHESDSGRHAFDVAAAGGYQLLIDDGWQPLVEASASYEAILLTINDTPLSARLDGRYRLVQPRPSDLPSTEAGHELSALAGLRLSLPVSW